MVFFSCDEDEIAVEETFEVVDYDEDGINDVDEVSCGSDPLKEESVCEVCDGIDNDADGFIDEDFDLDRDHFATCAGDCDDTDPNINPETPDVCNQIDDNCNGEIDEDCTVDEEICDGKDNNGDGEIDEDLPMYIYYFDEDEDGFGDPTNAVETCVDTPEKNYVTEMGDNCPAIYNPSQRDTDADGYGNVCDSDTGGLVFIMVTPNLRNNIEYSLKTYEDDLQKEGYDSEVYPLLAETPLRDIKNIIIDRYDNFNLVGVVFIGMLPVLKHKYQIDFGFYPAELYFADLDGEWSYTITEDEEENDFFDDIVAGDLNNPLEIWVSRIVPNSLFSEADRVNHYFARNHLYRTGALEMIGGEKALVFNDYGYAREDIYEAYDYDEDDPDNDGIDEIITAEDTVACTYKEKLALDYEFLYLNVRSSVVSHMFFVDPTDEDLVSQGSVLTGDINLIATKPFFYHFNTEHAGHFKTSLLGVPLYIAHAYMFPEHYGDTNGLVAVASTNGTVPILQDGFYSYLGQGFSFGQAFVNDSNKFLKGEKYLGDYGFVIFGDPTLKIRNGNSVFHVEE